MRVLDAEFVIDPGNVAVPIAVVALKQPVGECLSSGDDVTERVEEAAFVVAAAIETGPPGESAGGDPKHFGGQLTDRPPAGCRRTERVAGDRVAHRFALLH